MIELRCSTSESSRLDVYKLAGSCQDRHVFVPGIVLLSAALPSLWWKPVAWCSIRDDSLCHRRGLIMVPVTNHVTHGEEVIARAVSRMPLIFGLVPCPPGVSDPSRRAWEKRLGWASLVVIM